MVVSVTVLQLRSKNITRISVVTQAYVCVYGFMSRGTKILICVKATVGHEELLDGNV